MTLPVVPEPATTPTGTWSLPGSTIKILTFVSGVLAIVLPQLNTFNLPSNVQTAITVIGGILLAILAVLEHPTVQAVSATKARYYHALTHNTQVVTAKAQASYELISPPTTSPPTAPGA